MITFKDVLIPEPVNVTLFGEKDFVDVIKLRIFRWEDYPGLYIWAQFNHMCP